MNRLSKDKRDKLILVVLFTILALVALWYGVISLQRSKLDEIGKKTAEAEAKLARASDLVSSRDRIEAQLQVVSAKLKTMEAGMPAGDVYAWFIGLIDQFRASYPVDIPQKSREEIVDVGALPRFPYRAARFTVKGSAYFHDFGRFLAAFENTFPYMRVQNMELEPTAPAASSVEEREKLSFKFELVAVTSVPAAATGR